MQKCEDNSLALTNLGLFMADSGIPIESGMTNKERAAEEGFQFITCENSTSNTVIVVDSGEETKIDKFRPEVFPDCYQILYNGETCDVIAATERFQLEIIEQHLRNIGLIEFVTR